MSAKSGEGLDALIEMVLLVSDLQELTANPDRSVVGTIVEAELDKARGVVATALVQTGTLNVGDIIVVGETFGRVRALENERGKRWPSRLGWRVPSSSSVCPKYPRRATSCGSWPTTRRHAPRRAAQDRGRGEGRRWQRPRHARGPLQPDPGRSGQGAVQINWSDVSGSLGAITHALEQLDQDEVRVNVLHEAAGDITDNDIMLAVASNAIVVGFSTSITDTARRAAEAEGVDIRLYDIIYKLTDDIDAALKACSSRRKWRSSRAGQRSVR